MDILKDWRARRSGGRITINAIDIETGMQVKVPNVDTIEVRKGGLSMIVARDKNGDEYQLALG